jgi:hypothetical protein
MEPGRRVAVTLPLDARSLNLLPVP